jgi:GTP-binding protein HflX
MYRQQVNNIIEMLGAKDVPQIEVMNKIDLSDYTQRIDLAHAGTPTRAWLSAHTGDGIEQLLEHLGENFAKSIFSGLLTLPAKKARLRAKLYEDKAIQSETSSPEGEYLLEVKIQQHRLDALLHDENITLEQITNS